MYLKTYNRFAVPVDLVGQKGDHYEFTVQDDLTGLVSFGIRVDAALITRPDGTDM